MDNFNFIDSKGSATVFNKKNDITVLKQLCNVPMAYWYHNLKTSLVTLKIDHKQHLLDFSTASDIKITEDGFTLKWFIDDKAVILSQWIFEKQSGVWSRKDSITNTGSSSFILSECSSDFYFVAADSEVYTQKSSWCHESQGNWHPLTSAGLEFFSSEGRITKDWSPYACVKLTEMNLGIGFHLLPRSDWRMAFKGNIIDAGVPNAFSVHTGPSIKQFALEMKPKETYNLPEVLVQPVPQGIPENGTAILHRYLNSKDEYKAKKIPVVFNTWFGTFDQLAVEWLRKQAETAKAVGCDIFVVDAGWYGQNGPDWVSLIGDWTESKEKSFYGKMREFSDEVRKMGLGFGLWIEPERASEVSPIRQEHPDWFLQNSIGGYTLDITNSSAKNYIKSVFKNLIETYELVWMKIDYNTGLANDPTNSALSYYYEHWYGFLDELRADYPQVTFEGCASGGMRLDLESIKHFDTHFLSDTVNPWSVLRILQNGMLRLPPGFMSQWITVKPVGSNMIVAPYQLQPDYVNVPAQATWDYYEISPLNFTARVAMTGAMGLSGDIANLTDIQKQLIQKMISDYRDYQTILQGSCAHLLTPVKPIYDKIGWSVIQFTNEPKDQSLLFAFRGLNSSPMFLAQLKDIEPDKLYRVQNADQPDYDEKMTGKQLMNEGISVTLEKNNAAVFIIS